MYLGIPAFVRAMFFSLYSHSPWSSNRPRDSICSRVRTSQKSHAVRTSHLILPTSLRHADRKWNFSVNTKPKTLEVLSPLFPIHVPPGSYTLCTEYDPVWKFPISSKPWCETHIAVWLTLTISSLRNYLHIRLSQLFENWEHGQLRKRRCLWAESKEWTIGS